MPNIAVALREEIARLARKEIKSQTLALRRASAAHRRHIADLRRHLEGLERQLAHYQEQVPKNTQPQASDAKAVRYSAKRFQSNRKRLGLSAADYGKLIGVSAQTVYHWESGKARPRKERMAAYVSAHRGQERSQGTFRGPQRRMNKAHLSACWGVESWITKRTAPVLRR